MLPFAPFDFDTSSDRSDVSSIICIFANASIRFFSFARRACSSGGRSGSSTHFASLSLFIER